MRLPFAVGRRVTPQLDYLLALASFFLPSAVHWRLLTTNLTDRLYIYQDVTQTVYPSLVHLSHVARHGEFPVWNWHVYAGMYEGGAVYNLLLYPFNLPFVLGWLDPAQPAIFNGYLLLHLGAGAAGFYQLARHLRFHPYLSWVGACIYGLSFHGIYSLIAGPFFLLPFAWLPLVLAAWRAYALGRGSYWALIGGMAWFFCLLSGNPVAIVPVLPLIILWLLIWGREGRKRGLIASRTLSIGVLLGFGLAGGMWLGQALPLWESMSVTSRNSVPSYAWASSGWSGSKGFALLIRDFFLPNWGGGLYGSLGAAGTVLLLVGLWTARQGWERTLSKFVIAMAMVLFLPSALVAYDFAYLLIPLVSRLNGLDRGVLAFVLPATLLAMSGVSALVRKRVSWTSMPFGSTAVVLLLGYLVAYGFNRKIAEIFRISTEQSSALIVHMALFSAGTCLLLKLLINPSAALSTRRFLIALAVITFLDMSALARDHFFHSRDSLDGLRESLLAKNRSSYLLKEQPHMDEPSLASPRLNNTQKQESMLQSEDNVVGYYPFQPWWVTQAIVSAGFADGYLLRGPNTIDADIKWTSATVEGLYDLGPNRLGRAFPVRDGVLVPSARDALRAVAASDFDPSQRLVFQDWSVALADYPSLAAKIYSSMPLLARPSMSWDLPIPLPINSSTSLIAQSSSSASFLVTGDFNYFFFSNSWHPGWVAFVDGRQTPVYRANYAFLAVPLPGVSGIHRVDFVFRPAPYFIGLLLSGLFIAAWFGMFLWLGINRRLLSSNLSKFGKIT